MPESNRLPLVCFTSEFCVSADLHSAKQAVLQIDLFPNVVSASVRLQHSHTATRQRVCITFCLCGVNLYTYRNIFVACNFIYFVVGTVIETVLQG